MAKIWQISDGRSYVVNGDPGTTITYTNSPSNGTAAGKPVTSIPAGATSVTFPSNGSEVEISSDTATIDQVFNAAAAGSGSSSGGSGSAGGVTFQIVTTLPSQGAAGVIYLVKVSETGDDKFEEWIWVDSAWESIGTTAVDPTTYAKLIGGNTFEGNQVINGDLTVTGDVSGVVENSYYLTETTSTTITPRAGTWTRYTGSETALAIEEPAWTGEVDLAYLETPAPVTLTGVTWSPAEPVLTGDGPFVYTLVHSKEGEVLAGAYGYSTPTAEAIQAVAPIAWSIGDSGAHVDANNDGGLAIGKAAHSIGNGSIAIGKNSHGHSWGIGIGAGAQSYNNNAIAIGKNAHHAGASGIAIGAGADGGWPYSRHNAILIGAGTKCSADITVTLGTSFTETTDSGNVDHYCQTEGTGSITIGAGANTLNSTKTVDGVETTVESSNSITIGCKASNTAADSIVIGAQASGVGQFNVIIGTGAKGKADRGVAVGWEAQVGYYGVALGFSSRGERTAVALGSASKADGLSATAVGNSSTASAKYSIAIGQGATVSNTTNADNTINYSENAIAIGEYTTASAPNAVVLGAGATAGGNAAINKDGNNIAIGAGSKAVSNYDVAVGPASYSAGQASVSVGYNARAENHGNIAIGTSAGASGQESLAIGRYAAASQTWSTAIGFRAKATDQGVIVLATRSTIGDNKKTQFYIAGAGTALANEYYSGEAFMGYTVTDTNTGDVLACGTRRLSELFPDNSLTQPASLDENGEWVMPKVFHPSDLDLPVEEEPTEEPEDITINIPEPTIPEPEPYTPLPVYPIVTPEDVTTNIQDPEPYTPLPVYPIVEPEVPEIVETTVE